MAYGAHYQPKKPLSGKVVNLVSASRTLARQLPPTIRLVRVADLPACNKRGKTLLQRRHKCRPRSAVDRNNRTRHVS